jgi:4-hydroxybenzoate polyprenyltransferase
LNYSIPLFGFRFKDVPLIKTFFAPTIVTASVLGLPWLHHGTNGTDVTTLALASLRSWSFLMFNMIVCDLRDRAGDEACGIRSLPVMLGEKGTRWLLALLLVGIELLALSTFAIASDAHRRIWAVMCWLGPLYLGGIFLAILRPRSERFYEWVVEGMLFLPAVAVWIGSI